MRTTSRDLISAGFVLLLVFVTQGEGSLLRRFRRQKYGIGHPPPRPEGVAPSEDKWIEQHLDHMHPSDDRTYKQRYFMNDELYKEGGPVFLMIGGEGPASEGWMKDGAWYDYAKELNALLFQVEHRYYGKSRPTEDMSTENLAYLKSEQALADLANFTITMQKKMNLTENKWVAFGGSYAGALTAWYRLKYPTLVHAAVASSAPIDARVDFKEYMEVVRDSLATVSEDCNKAIKEANDKLVTMVKDPAKWDTISTQFKLCSALDGSKENDVSNLFEILADNFAFVVQYDGQFPFGIEDVCRIMMNETIGEPLDRYAQLNTDALRVFGEKCLDQRYETTIDFLRETDWIYNFGGGRTWYYQTCTEFGWYQSSDSTEQPFDQFPVDFFIDMCTDVFGANFTKDLVYKGVNITNAIYGGSQPNVTRVVFPNGSIDPWHAVGVVADLDTGAPAVYINGTAHCADMDSHTDTDPPELDEARKEIFKYLQQWLKED